MAFASCSVSAMPSAPGSIVASQPDGTLVNVTLRGDEHQNWYETQSGYTVLKNAAGQWVYALPVATLIKSASTLNAGIRESEFVVGADEHQLSNVPLHLQPGINVDLVNLPNYRAATTSGNPIAPRTGDVPLLVILGYYDDTLTSSSCSRCGTTDPEEFVKRVFNTDSKSVSDYYRAASQGKLNIIPSLEQHGTYNDGVVGWLSLGSALPNATLSISSLYKSNRVAADAINAAMPYVNFTAYDKNNDGIVTSRELGILVVVAAYEGSYGRNGKEQSLENDTASPRFWGQSRSFSPSSAVPIPVQVSEGKSVTINTRSYGMAYSIIGELHGDHIATLGIMVHELGHSLFGLPDLYDVSGKGSGVGVWSIMSYGSWGESSEDREAGETPVLADAWMRVSLGWINPSLPVAGSVHSVLSAADDQATIIKIPTAKASEYFLVENRQHYGYDMGLSGLLRTANFGGLAVWHIDDSVGSAGYNNDNADASHKRVDLMAAVGDELLDNGHSYGQKANLFYDGNSVKLDASTKPATHMYSGHPSDFSLYEVSFSSSPMTFIVNNSTEAVALATVSENNPTSVAEAPVSSSGGGAFDVTWCLLALSLVLARKSWRNSY